MMKEKLISIIVPIYNTEKYLKKCLDSIINQTYQNLEIILINDGSTDKSYDICKEYKDKDNRIVLINKKNNTGQADARNRGLKIAKGDYIGFVDSDDYIESNMFEKLMNAMYKYKAEISMCNMYVVEKGEIVDTNTIPKTIYGKLDYKSALIELMKDRNVGNYMWIKLFDKKLFEGIRFPKGKIFEDIDVVYKLFEKANNIAYIEDCMYYYVQREGSTLNSLSEKAVLDFVDILFKRYYYIKRKHADLQLYNVYSIVNTVTRVSRWAIRGNFLDLYNNEIKEYQNILKKELVLVDEGELIKIMTAFDKMSLYMLEIDRDIFIDVCKKMYAKLEAEKKNTMHKTKKEEKKQ